MSYEQLFWIHIKKSGGSTTRKLLKPYYLVVDKKNKPRNFIQASPQEYNDILNNYKMLLGEYQFRRSLFAKKYLYPDSWENYFSFAFSREPIDRCISTFFYLFWRNYGIDIRLKRSIKDYLKTGEFNYYSNSYAFDVFLERVQEARTSECIFHPLGNHFTTHTAPMWEDVTDLDGNILLTKIFRLENLVEGINQVFEECGFEKRIESKPGKVNKSINRQDFTPTKSQIKKIEEIYKKDFDIYETHAL